MSKLTKEQKNKFAEKFMDWGNIVFAGLVIAQIVPGNGGFRASIAIGGILNLIFSYLTAYVIMKGGIKK